VNSAGVPIGADWDPSIQTHSSPISIRCHLSEWGPDSVLKHSLNGSEKSMLPVSDQLHRPVVVAMIAMRVMQPSVHKVIDVVTMRDGFVSAVRTMLVP
jgi:hypothetical protein